mgnify:CR=1 FL=1
MRAYVRTPRSILSARDRTTHTVSHQLGTIVTEGFEPPTAHKQVSAPAYELRYDTACHGLHFCKNARLNFTYLIDCDLHTIWKLAKSHLSCGFQLIPTTIPSTYSGTIKHHITVYLIDSLCQTDNSLSAEHRRTVSHCP